MLWAVMRKALFSSLILLVSLNAAFAANYAVTPAYYDDIESVITPLGFTSDTINETDLSNLTLLKNYRAVFVNCSGSIATNFTADAADAVKEYVAEGGVIYASDWAFVVIAQAFPGYVSYYSTPRIAPTQIVTASVENEGMREYMGLDSFTVNFNLGGWVPIAGVNTTEVETILRGTSGDSYVKDKPILVKFDYGLGSVIYTSFHNEAGLSSDETNALEYMVLISVLSSTANNLATYLRNHGYIPVKESLNLSNAGIGRTFSYSQSATTDTDLAFAVGWKDTGAIGLSVSGPGFSQTSSNATSPFMIESARSINGTWNYTVTPAGATLAYVAMAAKRISAFDEVTAIKAYPNPYRADDHTVVVFEGLTEQATIRLYSMRGVLIKTIRKDDSSGTAFWNVDDEEGNKVPSGLYIYVAEGTKGSRQRGKVAIIR